MDLKQHDLAPALSITLTDHDPITDVTTPVDLTTAIGIKIIATQNNTSLFSRTATGNNAGVVTMPWQLGDTAVPGVIYIEIEVAWPPGNILQTYPPDGYLRVNVTADLG